MTRAAPATGAEIEQVFRAEHGRVVAQLTRRFGDLGVAEDAAGDALVKALEQWPSEGLPANPGAWLTLVAGRRAIDQLRRESVGRRKHEASAQMYDDLGDDPPDPTGPVEDDRLRLVFTCCHPALALEHRVALTLRMLGGLSVAEIAAAFLVAETTMAQRITRAKQKIKAAHVPYRLPAETDLAPRLSGVLAVLYLVFNEGYLASSGGALRTDLSAEAIRLTRQLREMVSGTPALGRRPEVDGLLALMLLTEARAGARVRDGELVTLDEQDRTRWDAAMIDEGHTLVRRCLALDRPGPYQVQAAIAAVHTDALDASMTDWSQVVRLYDQLAVLAPGPVVSLNRAVAVAELDGPEAGLALVEPLALTAYHAWHATRADLLRRLGRYDEARSAYDAALGLTDNDAEVALLSRRRRSLPDQSE